MSISKNEFIEIIEKIAPLEMAEEWDNAGFQVETKTSFKKILVCLDVTLEVIEEAVEKGVDLIVAHHPMIFSPIKIVNDPKLLALIKEGISVYSSHTNFDGAEYGNNAYLAKLLGLINVKPISLARIGEFMEIKSWDYIVKIIQEVLDTPISVIGGGNVKKVLICTGAGGDFVNEAADEGCDLLITGEVKYHEALLAKELGLAVIEAGHYGTEKIFIPNMAAQLLANDVNAEIFESKVNTNPY